MTELKSVVRYLGDVAESHSEFRPYVDSVIFVGLRPLVGHIAFPDRLRRLQAADVLHDEEHLVRVGRLWIVGTIDGVRYQWPIVRQVVSLGRSPRRPRVNAKGPIHLPPGLVEPTRLTEIALEHDDIWGSGTFWWLRYELADLAEFPDEPTPFLHRDDVRRAKLRAFLDSYLDAAGLPRLELHTGDKPPSDGEAVVVGGDGYYLERHPLALDRASALKLWTGFDLDGTALSPLYGGGARAGSETAAQANEPSLQTPLPLNQRQQAEVHSGRSAPLTVVSGPPGTGKSHLVAAAAIDHVANGQSVLVASQSIHACNVVAGLLDRYPMVEALRFGDDGSVRRLSDKLAAGIPASDDEFNVRLLTERCDTLADQINEHRARLSRRIGDVAAFERSLIQRHDVPLWLAHRDLNAIDLDAVRRAVRDNRHTGVLSWWRRRSARRTLRREFGTAVESYSERMEDVIEAVAAEQLFTAIAGRDLALDELWVELDRLEARWSDSIGDLLEAKRRDRANRSTRGSVQQLASALRQGPMKRRATLANVGTDFLQVVPLWLGTLSEIEAVLPITPALFDIVILDEASQISQLSALPALVRAKRAMIVGDSRQLRHVSFVSDAAQADAAKAHALHPELASRLNDRTNSVFDAATAVAPVIELDEHFRSAPHIIDFSNRTFYQDRLRLMTQHPRHEARDAIEVVAVTGNRDEARIVRPEIDEIVRRVRSAIDSTTESIGIVTPFRSQADALEGAVIEAFRLEEISRHRIRVGTVHSFQGTERDHIFISIGIGPADMRSLRFVEDPAVFNVMVTRARQHVTVVTSLDGSSAGNGLLGQYLRHAEEPPSPRRERLHASGWTQRVADELGRGTGDRVITDYEVARETIDVVVGTGDSALGIETEVHPDGPERHIDRRRALHRAGWEITSMHRSSCFGDEEAAILSLVQQVKARSASRDTS